MRGRALLLLSLGTLVGVHTARAQDPVKLSPNLYTVLLENDQVRALEYRVRPGDKEPMHSHPAVVVYHFTDGKARATTPDGKTQIIEWKAGETTWSEPVTHAWEYLGPGNGQVLIIELKNAGSAKSP